MPKTGKMLVPMQRITPRCIDRLTNLSTTKHRSMEPPAVASRLFLYYLKYLRRQSLTKVHRFNFSVLTDDPPIVLVYTPSGLDHVSHIASYIQPSKPLHVILVFRWYVNPVQVEELRFQIRQLTKRFPALRLYILCNSEQEYSSFQRYFPKVASYFISQNVVLDEEVYHVIPGAEKEYDAVYNARLEPFKRHILAAEIDKLAIITCGWKQKRFAYFKKLHSMLSHATWNNFDANLNYRKLSPRQVNEAINKARVGLILSKVEGACFAATEYLLAGIPVVSTASKGGRDVFFTPETSIIVDDNSRAVSEGVRELISRRLDPYFVRETTLEILCQHRSRLFDLINQILSQQNSAADYALKWSSIFRNKLLNVAEYDEFVDWYNRV